ncbi:SDR family NAD(P)-dependent oxidoreductase [Niabella yanshanensis]|uniref:NADP-dependent 3-hydroxy acid dehydrogenase YdfG n=1 Tax=Niabella yanshanensis TaxID=577386 RepID=A0ABZ0WDC3_9BACT|nr:SDR family NAD(P)-dependent oxidoreductase [Niabella yanshanensis]WQD40693.1 SDR family NAD(P)-dependent oxidoreductase [Niabella yanshanensis]
MTLLFQLLIALGQSARLAFKRNHVLVLTSICSVCITTLEAQQLPARLIYKNQQPFAIVAGGSKGIGYAIAEALAKRKYNLVLIARTEQPLKNAKKLLEEKYAVQVEILSADLTNDSVAPQLARWSRENNLPLKMLCNVAGMGGTNDFLKLSPDSVKYMIRLNLESPVTMVHHFLPLLEQNKPSYILNVSSMAGFSPIPVKNIYAASKSGLTFFSYSLRYQLKNKGVSVSCLTPGPVYTKPEIVKDTKEKLGWFGDFMEVPPARVGEIAVKKTLKRKMIIVPGKPARFTSNIIRALPRRWAASIYNALGKEN